MIILIILFGVLISVAGLVLLIKPGIVIGILESNYQSAWIHVIAIVVRFVLGLLLVSQAGLSKYPTIMEIFGWLSLVAALVLLIIGRNNFKKLMNWVINIVKPCSRIGGLLLSAFGVFLVYAFI